MQVRKHHVEPTIIIAVAVVVVIRVLLVLITTTTGTGHRRSIGARTPVRADAATAYGAGACGVQPLLEALFVEPVVTFVDFEERVDVFVLQKGVSMNG